MRKGTGMEADHATLEDHGGVCAGAVVRVGGGVIVVRQHLDAAVKPRDARLAARPRRVRHRVKVEAVGHHTA